MIIFKRKGPLNNLPFFQLEIGKAELNRKDILNPDFKTFLHSGLTGGHRSNNSYNFFIKAVT